jgi:hypothetical protein
MTTALEILDSAVKIALGALISGGAAFLVMRRTHQHDLKKAALEDKRGLLRSVAKLLGEASSALNLGTYTFEHKRVDGKADAQLLIDTLNKLSEARSLAMLSGARELETRIAQLRSAAEQLAAYYLEAGEAYAVSEANRLLVGISECWVKVSNELEAAYARLARDA